MGEMIYHGKVKQVWSTDGAFVAQLRSGAVVAWGHVSAVTVPWPMFSMATL